MRIYVIIVVLFVSLFGLLPTAMQAQSDGPPECTWTKAYNLAWDSPFTADSASAVALPAGSIVERVYWRVDTTLGSIDSLQLRSSASQVVLSTFTGDGGGDGSAAVQMRVPNHIAQAAESLYVILFGPEAARTGQIRLLLKYQEIY